MASGVSKCPWSLKPCFSAARCGSVWRDNLYLDKGVLATNAELVRRARSIIEVLGMRVLSASEARERIGLG